MKLWNSLRLRKEKCNESENGNSVMFLVWNFLKMIYGEEGIQKI